MSGFDVLVIGGGTDALVAAAYLAKAGRKPTVLEAGGQVGGKAVTREFHPGFRVSAGPHATGGVHPKLVQHLGLERDGLELLPRDPGVTTLRAEGKPIHVPGAAGQQSAGLTDRDVAGFERLTHLLHRVQDLLRDFLLLQPVPFERPPVTELLEPAKLAMKLAWGLKTSAQQRADLAELLRIGPQPLKDFLDDFLESEALKATLAAPAMLGTPLGPWSPGGVTNLLLWEASSFGGHLQRGGLPRGGLGAQSEALAKCARRLGADVRTGARVARILRDGPRVTGVQLASGETLTAPCVLSAVGPRTTFLELLDAQASNPRLRRRLLGYRHRGCVGKLHVALDGLPQLGDAPVPARVQLGESLAELERAHDDHKYGRASSRPLVDLVFPSVLDPSLAPDGQHVASALVGFVPYAPRAGAWDDASRAAWADQVVDRIDAALPGFAARVTAREALTPPDLERTLGSEGGHLHGGDVGLDQLFTNRPFPDCGSYRTPLQGLYVTGAATHPGGYFSGAAGANAARRVLGDWRSLA